MEVRIVKVKSLEHIVQVKRWWGWSTQFRKINLPGTGTFYTHKEFFVSAEEAEQWARTTFVSKEIIKEFVL